MLPPCLTRIGRIGPATLLTIAVLGGCSSGSRLMRQQGIDAYEAHNLAAAGRSLHEAIEHDPTDWKSLYYLGRVRLEQRRLLEAQLVLEKAYELRHHDPETADILDALAEALRRRDRFSELNKLLDQAVESYGTSRDYARKGRHLQQLGDIDGAKLAYRKAAFFAPERDPGPFLALADFYESISDSANAITALRHAYSVTPGDSLLKDRLRRYGIVPGPTTGIEPDKVVPGPITGSTAPSSAPGHSTGTAPEDLQP